METIRGLVRQIESGWTYALRCAKGSTAAPACDSFWTWAAVAAAAAIALVALYGLGKTARHFLAVRAEKERLAESARVADEETMAQYRVEGEKLYAGSSEEDVEQRIRRALDERKIKDRWQRPGPSRKKEGGE